MEILKLILKRIVYGVAVVMIVAVAISSLIYLGQVDPARMTFGQRADIETVESKRAELGLDQSLSKQLTLYLKDISPFGKKSNGHFGFKVPNLRNSFQTGQSVSKLIFQAFPLTLILSTAAFGFAIFLGTILGVFSALNFNKPLDKWILTFSSLGYSLPSYVIAMAVAILFAYYLGTYTGLNLQGSLWELNELGDDVLVWKNLILPTFALGIRPLAIITQITRSTLLETLSQPYVVTARAKGLSFRKTLRKHAFPNALNPIVTAISGWFASLLAGAFFVETVFNYKGLGNLTVNALVQYDLPLILGCILFTSVLFICINILTDVFYLLTDPKRLK